MRRRAGELRPFTVLFSLVLWSVPLAAEEPGLRTEVKCEPLPGPGKMQCSVQVRATSGGFRWGDVIVIAAPPFAPPLRTRLAASDATRSDAEGADFGLALAATADGAGDLRVRARALVCGARGCRPVTAEGATRVLVGAQASSP